MWFIFFCLDIPLMSLQTINPNHKEYSDDNSEILDKRNLVQLLLAVPDSDGIVINNSQNDAWRSQERHPILGLIT